MAPSSSQLPLLAVLAMVVCATVQMQLPPSCEAMPSRNHDLLMLGRFHRWMSAHNRSYAGPDEKLRRFDVYRRNVEYIDAANAAGELGYELGENEFTDLTHQEFMAHYTGGRFVSGGGVRDASAHHGATITTLVGDVDEGRRETMERVKIGPDNLDWNKKGYVTPAKNQKGCGACWAFAAAGAIESQIKMTTGKGGKLLDLSEQELIDCDLTNQSGCMGGSPYHAFKWIKDKGGMLEESEYPYEAQDGQCRINDSAIRKGKISTFGFVEEDEDELQDAVYSWGPTVVGIDSHDPNLKHFRSGIYKGPCGTNLDHAVLVVGYGVNKAGEKYWIVKNSWGETWGENGFFLMSRGENGKAGLCGIALTATFVKVMY